MRAPVLLIVIADFGGGRYCRSQQAEQNATRRTVLQQTTGRTRG